ncbi:RNA-binding protein [Angomonas deanei]|uniref:RNA recognition motif. (A.k.a. RRM, RBD, or RNP domain), putative n=1 Tax=Angomonas deanei TaxID=59799 RepID=A0A7G2CFM9_9TRYP|nr:RNA-binding protein [Angomonas deanei]CAD2217684.1 RNA recognition motif. (a.k.a. RRM, RBD, or RNP domain), putative [Angomonas deanei]|eukprot:EPY21552.1 RNA-binding protein [Angomonas deanei]
MAAATTTPIPHNNNNNNNNNHHNTARLFVGQLNFDATETDVQQIFSFYGHVLHVNILRDVNKSTGSAFVTYATTTEADNAIIALHDRYNMGREKPLQVSYCRRSETVSAFGYQHATELNNNNNSNPLPPRRS